MDTPACPTPGCDGTWFVIHGLDDTGRDMIIGQAAMKQRKGLMTAWLPPHILAEGGRALSSVAGAMTKAPVTTESHLFLFYL